MAKVVKKVFIIMLIIYICGIITMPTVNALSVNNAINGAGNFLQRNSMNIINQQNLYNVFNVIYGTIMGIAIAVAVIVGISIGIRIILGSVAEKVDAKQMLIPYLWCIVGLAFAGGIIRAIAQLLMDLFT